MVGPFCHYAILQSPVIDGPDYDGAIQMSHHIIEATDLHYSYPDGTEGIKEISFRITHGESVAIVGASFECRSNGAIQP